MMPVSGGIFSVFSIIKSFARKVLRFERGRRREPIRRGTLGRAHLRFESLEDRTTPAKIALFFDPAFVDTSSGGFGEAFNMNAALVAQGNTVTTFTGTTAAAFTGALSGNDLLVIPELENGDLNAALTPAARTVIHDFVAVAGHGMITNGDLSSFNLALLNSVFSFGLTRTFPGGASSALNVANAAGTAFDGGPASIPHQSLTVSVTTASLPAGATPVYESATDATVANFRFGNGEIAILGWDFFAAQPVGTQDGGWLAVLDSAVKQVATSLTASLDSQGNLVVNDASFGGENNQLGVVKSGANFVLTDANQAFTSVTGIAGAVLSNSNHTLTVPIASVTGSRIIFNAAGGNDTLTLDHSGGMFGKGFGYDGGTGANNSLVMTGNPGVTLNREHSIPFGPNSGTIVFDADGSTGANPILKQFMYGGVGNQGTNAGALMFVDPTVGTGTLIADNVAGGLSGLEFLPNGRLFGTIVTGLGSPASLVEFNPFSGAIIGAPIVVHDIDSNIRISDLAVQPGTGLLFGIGSDTSGGVLGTLFEIDVTTGFATLVGGTGLGYDGGLAFAPDGTLYMSSANNGNPRLHTLNSATAAVLTTVTLSGATTNLDGLAIRPTDGTMFGTRPGFFGGDLIVRVDPATGVTTAVGPTGIGGASDLAFTSYLTGSNGDEEVVDYSNLTPITDTVPAVNYNFSSTVGTETINFVDGPIVGVQTTQINDNGGGFFELHNFASKTNVSLNSRFGADAINIAYTTPAVGWGTLTIDDFGAAAADTLTVNGIVGQLNDLRHVPTGPNAGQVVDDSGSIVNIQFAKITQLQLNVQAADNDDVRLDGTIGDDQFNFFATTTAGSGSFTGTMDQNNATGFGPFALTPTSYQGNSNTNDIDVNFFVPGGTDTLTFNGTGSDDQIDIYGGGGGGRGLKNTLIAGAVLTADLEVFNTVGRTILAGGGNDSMVFENGQVLGTGIIDGQTGTNTVQYGFYTTAVAVNLGTNVTGGALSATLGGDQENPAQTTPVTGTATFVYNNVTHTLDIHAHVFNLAPGLVTGYHIHRAPVAVNGPIVIDLAALFGLGALVSDGSGGFTFDALGVAVAATDEAAVLGGITYINFHTAAAPGGLVRGQIYPSALFVAAPGTATGTAGISNIDIAVGGSGNDSLVGNGNANTIVGNAGNDTIVGARGNDNMLGSLNDDVMVWSNGDGTDVIDGGIGNDTVQVNGNVTAVDNFRVSAGAGGRINFQRVAPSAPFGLDIGTVETLTVAGIGGNDDFVVNDLTGVTDLTTLNLVGEDGNDVFTFAAIAPAGIAFNVKGGAGADTIVGPNANLTWNITGNNSGNVPTLLNTFENVENLTGGAGNDSFVFSDTFGVTGSIDGGAGANLLDYSAYTTGVGVNLGTNAPAGALVATLGGDQENPAQTTTANGTATFVYNAATKTLDIHAHIFNLLPGAVTGYHIHRAPFGVNGGIIIDLAALFGLAALVSDGSGGFTFDAVGVAVPAGNEAAVLGGITYLNFHTAAAPGGLIRGQIYANGAFVAASGTATGTGGIANIDTAIGGSAADSLVGNGNANVLSGNAGNDTIVGARGNDTVSGGLNDDVIVWSNGDNNDTFDGDGGNDIVQVNGAVAGTGDAFSLNPDAGVPTRLFFQRTNLVPFNISTGTTERFIVNGVGGDDNFAVGDLTGVATLTQLDLNGEDGNESIAFAALAPAGMSFTVKGGVGNDTITGPNANLTWNITGNNSGNVPTLLTSFVNVENLIGGTGADTFVFSDGFGVAGTINGGTGNNLLDYSAYTTSVNANLGTNVTGGSLVANLEGEQENPSQTTTATGTATFVYNSVNKTLDIHVQVSNLLPGAITGYHIHRAPFGVNGGIIMDLAAIFGLGALVADGLGGFTFDALGVPVPAINEAALLGGITYINFHTAAAPGGLIRGQIFPSALFVTAGGTATGTAGVSNIDNVTGGSAGDSLLGNGNANTISGNAGNDTIVGARGNDNMFGGANDDVMVWSNGDGTDVIDGNLGTDRVQVNGNVTGIDNFVIAAGAGGRVNFQRLAPGPFGLDIGTVETLSTLGIGGDDNFTVNDLTGVADLTQLDLVGLDGNDTFNVRTQATITTNVRGFSPVAPATPGDTLNFNTTGLAFAPTTTSIAQAGRLPVNYSNIETKNILPPGGNVTVDGTNGADIITLTGDGTNFQFNLNGAVFNYTGGAATTFTFNGLDGADRMIVNYVNGDPIPAGGISYLGGNQADALNIIGTLAESAVYRPSATTFGSGVIDFGGTNIVTFAGLEPVLFDNMLNVTLNLPNANDQVDMNIGQFDFDGNVVTPDLDGLIFTGFSGGVAFESMAVRFTVNIFVDTSTVDLAGSPDAINLIQGDNNHQNDNLFVFTGANGADTITVNGPVAFVDAINCVIQLVSNGSVTLNSTLSATGLVDLTATTGTITGQAGAGTDIFADFIALSANGDIGAAADPIETQAFNVVVQTNNFLEANSVTGGIFLINTGNLGIGNVDFGFNVFAGVTAAGAIDITNNGTLSVTLNAETIFAGGSITLIAQDSLGLGLNGDIVVGSQTGDRTLAATRRAIESTGVGAVIRLQADRNIQLGDAIGWGDVFNQNGFLTFIDADFDQNSTGDVTIRNSTLVQVFGFGGLITVAGDNVSILNSAATFSALQTAGGQISFQVGFVGLAFQSVLTIQVGVANPALGVTDTVSTTLLAQPGADIFIQADDVVLTAGGAGLLALRAGVGSLDIYQVTLANIIELGNLVALNRLNLDNAEFQLMAASIVRIGGDPGNFVSNTPLNTGDILITQPILQPAGWNTLALRTAGSISEAATGGLTVDNLLLVGLTGVNLCDGSNIIRTLAGLTNPGFDFKVANNFAGAFVIGTVDGVSGIIAAGGQITVFAPNASLSIQQAIVANQTGTVRLTANDGISQTVAGTITAGTLGARNVGAGVTGNIELTNPSNQVATFAARNEAANGKVRLVDNSLAPLHELHVGAVSVDGACFVATVGITTANGDVTLKVSGVSSTTGKLFVDQKVDVGTGTVRLYAIAGISELQSTGVIYAQSLSVLNAGTAGDITLDTFNQVTNFAAYNNSPAGRIGFNDLGNLVVNTVAADSLLPQISGVTTQSGNAIIATLTGSMSLNAPVNVGSGQIALLAFNGITQTATGAIVALYLGAENANSNSIVFDNANNFVNVFAARNLVPGGLNTAAGRIVLRNNLSYAIGTVTIAPIANASIAGFEQAAGIVPNDDSIVGTQTANGDIILNTVGITVPNAQINAGTGLVAITSSGGVLEYPGGIITAGYLGITGVTTGNVFLTQVNQINGVLAIRNTNPSGVIYLINNGNLQVGAIAATTLFAGVTGITSNDGEMAIVTDGSIGIGQVIDAGLSRVRLQATKGITETAVPGLVRAFDLVASNVAGVGAATGNVFLMQGNSVINFAAKNETPNGIVAFRNDKSVNVSTVPGIDSLIAGRVGVSTNNGDVTYFADGAIALVNLTNAGTGITRIFATKGVTQFAGGPVLASALSVQNQNGALPVAGSIFLPANNQVNSFAAFQQLAGGLVQLFNGKSLTIGTVNGNGLVGPTSGIFTNNGPVTINVVGDLTVNNNIISGTGPISLTLPGKLTVRAFMSANVSFEGVGSGSLDLNRKLATGGGEFVYDTIVHDLINATSGKITYTTPGGGILAPTMTINYAHLDNTKPIVDNDSAASRTFNVLPINKISKLSDANGTLSKISTKDSSTMTVNFAAKPNSFGPNATKLLVNIASAIGGNAFNPVTLTTLTAADETNPANPELNVVDAAIYIDNLAGGVNKDDKNNPSVLVKVVGGAGRDRFIFKNDTSLVWKNGVAFASAIDGGASNDDILDYSRYLAVGGKLTVDLERSRASNLSCCNDNGLANIEDVVVGNQNLIVTLTANTLAANKRAVFVVGSTSARMSVTSTANIRLDNNSDIPNNNGVADIVRYFGNNGQLLLAVDNVNAVVAFRDDFGQNLPPNAAGPKVQGIIDNAAGGIGGGNNVIVSSAGIQRAGGKGGLDLFAGITVRNPDGSIKQDQFGLAITALPTPTESEAFLVNALQMAVGRNINTLPGVLGKEQFDQTDLVSNARQGATSYIFVRQFLSRGYNNYGPAEFYQAEVYRFFQDSFATVNGVATAGLTLDALKTNVNADLTAFGFNATATINGLVAPMLSPNSQDESVAATNFFTSAYFQQKAQQQTGLAANAAWTREFLRSARVLGNFSTPAIEANVLAQLNGGTSKAAIIGSIFATAEHRNAIVRNWLLRFIYDGVYSLRTPANAAAFDAKIASLHFERRVNEAFAAAIDILQNGTSEFSALEQILNSEAMFVASQIKSSFGTGADC